MIKFFSLSLLLLFVVFLLLLSSREGGIKSFFFFLQPQGGMAHFQSKRDSLDRYNQCPDFNEIKRWRRDHVEADCSSLMH